MRDAICLASGGLDSTVCLALTKRLGYNSVPMFVDYGQINRDREYGSLKAAVAKLKLAEPITLNFSDYGRIIRSGLTDRSLDVVRDAFTPGRNMLLLITAASVAHHMGINNVVMGLLSEETILFPDQSDNFLRATEKAIEAALGVSISIVTPLRDYRKSDVVHLANELGIDAFYSCHAGTVPPCGKCIACQEYVGG